MRLLHILFVLNLWLNLFTCSEQADSFDDPHTVTYLAPGTSYDFIAAPLRSANYDGGDLHIYCYAGKKVSLFSIFETMRMKLYMDSQDDEYTQYEGETPEEVRKHYIDHTSLFSLTLFSQKRPILDLSPFRHQCIGIASQKNYTIHLERIRININYIVLLLCGIILYFNADRLSKNHFFYYITGILVGVCLSFLALVYLIAKFIPRRPMMISILVGGWTLGLLFIKWIVDNIQLIIITHRQFVCYYLIGTSLISFLICYRIGPPTNVRSKKIIKWLIQLCGLIAVYFSSFFEIAVIAIIALIIIIDHYPIDTIRKLHKYYRRRFPVQRRLLTMREYKRQGFVETKRSLAVLRDYVNSPECQQWRLMKNLSDPTRFANFANDGEHLTEDEIYEYLQEQLSQHNEEDLNMFMFNNLDQYHIRRRPPPPAVIDSSIRNNVNPRRPLVQRQIQNRFRDEYDYAFNFHNGRMLNGQPNVVANREVEQENENNENIENDYDAAAEIVENPVVQPVPRPPIYNNRRH